MKTALVLGCNGQDGSYLCELLVAKGYKVHGLVRKTSSNILRNIDNFKNEINIHVGDLIDVISLANLIREVSPDEIYNEADQDHVGTSYLIPGYSFDVTGTAVGNLLEIVRQINPKIKIFQPVSSNIFGGTSGPHDENATLDPRSPYACSKAFAMHLCHMYRHTYGMYVSVGILFNHESERRTEHYVTRKITKSVARIAVGLQNELVLGDVSAKLDWGYAPEYMEAAWRMMQLPDSHTVVLGTGVLHSVMDFVELAMSLANLDPAIYLKSSAALTRPSTTAPLVAKCDKARSLIGFQPKVEFEQLVTRMTQFDMKHTRRDMET